MKNTSPQPDWTVIQMVGLLWQFFRPVQGRAREGRAVILRSLAAVFRHHSNLSVDYLGPAPGTPYDPHTGDGYLLVDGRCLVDVTTNGDITPEQVRQRLEQNPHPYPVYLLQYGQRLPAWYPGRVPDAPQPMQGV